MTRFPFLASVLPLLFVCFFCMPVFGQSNISGTINSYTSVTSTANIASDALTVASTAGLGIGDLVLIIQMQGATITESNSASFGTITNYNGAGKYELATICDIIGNELTFQNELVNTDYQVSGIVQVIKVPIYTSAVVTDTLRAPAWNGNSGGVVVLSVAEKLLLNAPIVMDGRGFRGGAYVNSGLTCNAFSNRNAYFYTNTGAGASKGEGIANYINLKEYGKGSQANGGGGGNDHNAGGGGGSNGNVGGNGGENDDPGTFNCKGRHPGLGGIAPVQGNRLYLGGGGGSGHGNNSLGTGGASGGGIILILADTLEVGLSNKVTANGGDAIDSESDGAGGGGAGGSIHLEVNTFVGVPSLEAMGGDGGDARNDFVNRCFGPGGGGSGGVIKVQVALPGSIIPVVTGGTNGLTTQSSNSCNNSSNFASSGAGGTTPIASIPEGTTGSAFCQPLPLNWVQVEIAEIDQTPYLKWMVAQEPIGGDFHVEYSLDASSWQQLASIQGQGSQSGFKNYQWPLGFSTATETYYRISFEDVDGRMEASPVVSLKSHGLSGRWDIIPNPGKEGTAAFVKVFLNSAGWLDIEVMDMQGRNLARSQNRVQAGEQLLALPNTHISPGMYVVRVRFEGKSELKKWLVRP